MAFISLWSCALSFLPSSCSFPRRETRTGAKSRCFVVFFSSSPQLMTVQEGGQIDLRF